MNETYALLWSKKSNGFHIEPLDRTAQSDTRFFHEDTSNDYLLIAYGSHDEMDAKAEELRPTVFRREEVRRNGETIA